MGKVKQMVIEEMNLSADNRVRTPFLIKSLINGANCQSSLIASIDDNNYEHHEEDIFNCCWHFTKEQLLEIDGQWVETDESRYGIDSDDNYCSYIKL